MRSAESLLRVAAAAVATATVTGCATVIELKERVMAPSSQAAAAAPPAASAAPTPAPLPIAAVVEATPASPVAQRAFDEANRLLRAGRTAEAERAYRALAQSHPDYGGPHANLGVIHRRAGRLPEALAEFELAVKASPKQPVYLNQLGITYRHLGQFEKARDAYERAIAADARYPAATLNLGILNDLYLGDARRAAELYERYLALSPGGDPAVTKWVAELKNRKAAAITVSRKEQS